MVSKCRNTPIATQRQLRQEANFGCSRCGCPILDNAHIIPYNISYKFPVEDMLALCPTCHRIADDGHYSESYLRKLKANPHNKVKIEERFLIEGQDVKVNIGGNEVVNCPSILTINDFDIISIKRESENYLLLDLNLFDKYHQLIGIIQENKWTVDTTDLWDIEYKPQHLKIRNALGKISFEIMIENGEVFILGILYFYGHPIHILKDELWLGEINNSSSFKRCRFKNAIRSAIYMQL